MLRRKTDHSVIERRRREKINERLIRLQEMVPACREEALDCLDKKPPKAARGAKVDAETKHREIEKCLSETMVLEKLCIISHAVGESSQEHLRCATALADSSYNADYITELRSTVHAYKQMCQCDPPLVPTAPRDPTQHVKFAHELEGPSDSLQRSSTSASSSASPTYPITPPDHEFIGTQLPPSTFASSGPKRKRHWGSNRPIKVDASSTQSKEHGAGAPSQSARKRVRGIGGRPQTALDCQRRASTGTISDGRVAESVDGHDDPEEDGNLEEDNEEYADDSDDQFDGEEGDDDAETHISATLSDEQMIGDDGAASSRQRRASDPQAGVTIPYSALQRFPFLMPRHYQHRHHPMHLGTRATGKAISERFQEDMPNARPTGLASFQTQERGRHLSKISSILSLESGSRDIFMGPIRPAFESSINVDMQPRKASMPAAHHSSSPSPGSPLEDGRLALLAKVSTTRSPHPTIA